MVRPVTTSHSTKERRVYSETPDILAFNTARKIEVLPAHEIKRVQAGTYELLQEVGVHFPSHRALKIFADHGAIVDWNTEIVRIHPDLVDKAMATAPRSFVLGGREERLDLVLDGSASYLCTDGCGV
jgi:trimethylamine--corrinoid protein Co-methyltransferase